MARTEINMQFRDLLRNHKEYDLVILGLQECPRNYKERLIQSLDAHMMGLDATKPDFLQIANIGMWELQSVAYIKGPLKKHVKDVKTNSVATGVLGIVGNKGGVQLRFQLYDHSFNIIDVHLHAGAFQMPQRLEMMARINKELQK